MIRRPPRSTPMLNRRQRQMCIRDSFHPLEFIFHFRKCGWRSKNELLQLIPDHVIRKPGSHNSPSNGVWEQPNIATASNFLDRHRIELCKSLRKFSIETPMRQACFFGNATQETGWFKDLRESGGLNPSLHLGWYGRGFLQLTNKDGNIAGGNNNYYKYFRFLGSCLLYTSDAADDSALV